MNRNFMLLLSILALGIASCAGHGSSLGLPSNASVGPRDVTKAARVSRAIVAPSVATPAPTPYYRNAKAYANFVNANPAATPVAISIPSGPNVSVVASYKCKPNASGGTIIGLTNAWFLEGGTCNGAPNPADASGLHFYDVANGVQAVPSTALTSGVPYLIVGTQNGTALTFYYCAVSCSSLSVADNNPLASGSSGFIGESNPGTRVALGDVWNVQIFNYAVSATQVQSLANTAPSDPFPTPTPNSNGPFSNTNPVRQSGLHTRPMFFTLTGISFV